MDENRILRTLEDRGIIGERKRVRTKYMVVKMDNPYSRDVKVIYSDLDSLTRAESLRESLESRPGVFVVVEVRVSTQATGTLITPTVSV